MFKTAVKPRGVTSNDIVRYMLTAERRALINKYAKNARIGGMSNVHTDDAERQARLLTDQVAGMTGNLFGNYHLDDNYDAFIASRELADKNPHKGDGGEDRINCGLDFKCSFMRSSDDPLAYSMLVRPKERHPTWTYVQFLIGARDLPSYKTGTVIYLLGWADEDDLPTEVEKSGPFEGAFRIPVKQLRPIRPFPEFLTWTR